MPPARGSRAVVPLLALVVLLQAYPSAVWVQARLRNRTAVVVPPPAPPPVPAALAAAAICPPAPSDLAGTSGSVSPVAAAPAPASRPPAVPPAASAAAPLVAGVLSVVAPVPLEVYLRGQLVGTTQAERTLLPVGTHDLEFVNEAFGYRARRTVAIRQGATSRVQLEAPSGTLHVNAVPWAEVWVDGKHIGETPIGNFRLPIGSREIVFKHPELGERRATALVSLKEPARISIDLRKK